MVKLENLKAGSLELILKIIKKSDSFTSDFVETIEVFVEVLQELQGITFRLPPTLMRYSKKRVKMKCRHPLKPHGILLSHQGLRSLVELTKSHTKTHAYTPKTDILKYLRSNILKL